MMHRASMACADKAEALIAKGDDDSLRYACLELRMAIEHLFYDMIPSYADEVPNDLIRQWQPKEVIHALLDCDPRVDHDGSLEMADKQGKQIAAFEYHGVKKRLIGDYWHKLGSYLHASMTEITPDWTKAVPFLRKAISAVRDYGHERALVKQGEYLRFDCTCGRTIKRNIEAIKIKPRIVCPDVRCGQIWKPVDADYKRVGVVTTWFACGKCEAVNHIEERHKADGKLLACKSCGAKYKACLQLVLEPQSEK